MDRYNRTISALEWLNCCEYTQDQWIKFVLCIKDYLGEDGRELARDWSATDADRFTEYAFRKAWDHSDGRQNGESALFGEAKAKGWSPVSESPMTAEQAQAMEASKALARERLEKEKEEKAKKFSEALRSYNSADIASGNEPYLAAKGLQLPLTCTDIKTNDSGSILLPAKNKSGDVVGVQVITGAGRKYIYGSQSYGFYTIGNPSSGDSVWLCEGLATGITGHLATKDPVIVCFTADNIKNVANALSDRYSLSILADNDSERTNKGLSVALETGLPYSMPSFDNYSGRSGDWDDLRMQTSVQVVSREIRKQLKGCDSGMELPCSIDVDLLSPPDFVGDVARWMESNGRTDTRKICSLGAIYAIGAIGSLSHCKSECGGAIKTNVFGFCLSPSGTGKDTVYDGVAEIFSAAGLGEANQGDTMSTQEIQRNLFDSQLGSYVIDEVAHELKLASSGGHNSGIVKQFTAAFTKLDKKWSGRKTEFKAFLSARRKEMAAIHGVLEEGYDGDEPLTDERREYLEGLHEAFKKDNETYLAGNSFDSPSVNLLGLSTPENFNAMIDHEKIQDGFFGRCFIVEEFNDNPRFKKGWKPTPMPLGMKMALMSIASGGESEPFYSEVGIRAPSSKKPVGTSGEASQLLDDIGEYFIELGEALRSHGAVALSRRGYEMVDKVSYILSFCAGSSSSAVRYRTYEHVQWAFAFVLADIRNKVEIARTNSAEEFDARTDAVSRVALRTVKRGESLAMSLSEIRSYGKNRKYGAEEFKIALDDLESSTIVKVTMTKRGTKKYYK